MSRPAANAPLFVLAAFSGAALIFFVQPMVARLVLPLLGGSPAVWATSMAFFQAALLAGYGYAHALQRIGSVRTQAAVHMAVLLLAALVLPLRVTHLVGDPTEGEPALWLLGVLTISVGAPFAALAATAPLVQAWHARAVPEHPPWRLYVASNLGSLVALLAYPIAVEPWVSLDAQRLGWSIAYAAFVLLMAALAFAASRSATPAPRQRAGGSSWRERLTWLGLAAIPSSLMLGVTTHLATDVASAPFLWVIPLALYLITFIIAFQERRWIPRGVALLAQAVMLPACVFLLPVGGPITLQFAVHLSAFFLSALVCHQALAARRPDPARLTEFYLWVSLGGVIGGAFNAFVAPVIFNSVMEYPLALVLAALARPWSRRPLVTWQISILIATLLATAAAMWMVAHPPDGIFSQRVYDTVKLMLVGAVAGTFLMRANSRAFIAMLILLSFAAHAAGQRQEVIRLDRSFFGVLRQSRYEVPVLGELRLLAHGTTLHGLQAKDPRYRCQPLAYYTPRTAIGQVFNTELARKPALNIATVGLGAGAVATYTRPTDHMTFFEIDPLVVKVSTDPANFTYVTDCAHGRIEFVTGDARLTLARQPPEAFDIILIDAFSSDAIPTHLLTVEAMRIYLSRLKPDGVVVLHLSNRNLALLGPAHAIAKAAGAYSMEQRYRPPPDSPHMWESSEDVVIVAKTDDAIDRYFEQATWDLPPPSHARPWTDNYTNVPGALVERLLNPYD
ncbi:MAG TPA: fused MFS/spermidine synthase [Caulobacteraceae bacterium]